MDDRLQPILEAKRQHVMRQKRSIPLATIEARAAQAGAPRGFAAALRAKITAGGYGLIAEIKRASPSRGLIRADFDPPALARAYREGGAACLSVLTDNPYFQGDDSYLRAVREAVDLPVLRKDFIVDPYQIPESRSLGADCILLIMAALDDAQARDFYDMATGYGMDVLVEVHDEAELQRALVLNPRLLGINNRNLKTLAVDVQTALSLAPLIPAGVLAVGESGLATPADLARLAAVNVNCFLIGETLMRKADVAAATRRILTRDSR